MSDIRGQGGEPRQRREAPPERPIHEALFAMTIDPQTQKARKRSAAKAANRQNDQKTKVTLYVPADLARRFAVHATYTNMDRSALFAEMIREHCKRFVVSDRAKADDDTSDESVE